MFGAVRVPLNAKGPKTAFKGVLFTAWALIHNSHNNGSMRQLLRFCGVLRGSVLCVHAASGPAVLGALCGVLGRLICWAVVRSVHLQKWLCASCEALQLYFCIADGLKLGAVLPALLLGVQWINSARRSDLIRVAVLPGRGVSFSAFSAVWIGARCIVSAALKLGRVV